MTDDSPTTQAVSATTQWRDAKCTPEELSVRQLARELGALVTKYPRFKSQLCKLQAYVTNQLQNSENKQAAIIWVLNNSGWPQLDIDEIVSETRLDEESVRLELIAMVKQGSVDQLDHNGRRLTAEPGTRRRHGRSEDGVYYRAAVPSPTSARRG